MIYADNAATTKLDIDAFEAMKPYLLSEYGNASQLYSFARNPKRALREARATIAKCINAEPEEIFFTSGGTESDNWAIKGVALADDEKHAIITSHIEHHAVLRSCEAVEKFGYPVTYLPVTNDGIVTTEILESLITPAACLVSVMFVNNETGTIEPIKELCEIAHKNGALFHTDAVQAVGHIQIDVKEIGVDLLSASAHKFNGPKGIGFLYIKKGTIIEHLIDGGYQEDGYRAGTENVASIIGMAVALKKNCDLIEENEKHIRQLEKKLLESLLEKNIRFTKNVFGETVPGILSLAFSGFEGEILLHRLDLLGIQVSTGSACDSVNTQISHVLQAIGVDEATALGTIRISLGKENTIEDVLDIASAISKIVKN